MDSRRLTQIERHLNRLGSLVEGNQKFQADRISDVMDQIEELRVELETVKGTLDKARQAYSELKQHISKEE